ncbi:hypothetical protein V565_087240 [Rhizoctonia solani 123E]|uniref:CHD5 domain protein n=1 Tax=Rhizoctonia solani 123E TaxID=1423351 RepID=A0A074RT45_9AGAM|nr:hypothetical protein V565_087240 [Rhizoctonia solani 123E]
MATRGYFAYRYKRRYYRQYIPHGAYPEYWGNKLAQLVPRDPHKREAWIHATTVMLEKAELKDAEREEDEYEIDTEGLFNSIIDSDWTFLDNDIDIDWTYVIDLDNNAFTVDGSTHFKLDDMPPESIGLEFFFEDEYPGRVLQVNTRSQPQLSRHLTTVVDLWPGPLFDVDKAQEEYETLNPTILPYSKWKLPTWSTLSVSQKFAMKRLQIVLDKYSHILDKGYLIHDSRFLGCICWQITCASTHVLPICPTRDSLSYSNSLTLMGFKDFERGHFARVLQPEPTPYGWNPDSFCYREYLRIAGCMVAYCPILDQPAFVASEVRQMVDNIRNSKGPLNGTGIILSGRHALVVRVEMNESGLRVCHSPVMDIYDCEGRVSEGALLLVHFLQRDPSLHRTHDQSFPLPPEIMTQIVRYADFGTYLCLTLVSWSVRAICLAYPRIGEYTVISQDLRHKEGSTLIVQHSATSFTYPAIVKAKTNRVALGPYCMTWDIKKE